MVLEIDLSSWPCRMAREKQVGEEIDTLESQSRAAWGDWFFESQECAMCGQHALNNLLGVQQYGKELLELACLTILAESDDHPAFHL